MTTLPSRPALCQLLHVAFASALTVVGASEAFAVPGDLDAKFGGFGFVGKLQSTGMTANAVTIDDQGRVILAGVQNGTFHVQRRSGWKFLAVENQGIVISVAQSSAVANAVAIDPDGRIVVAGTVTIDGLREFAVARFNTDLTPDATFAGTGAVYTDFDGRDDAAAGVAVQANGRIVVVGGARFDDDFDVAIARYLDDGQLDPSFGGDGRVVRPYPLGGVDEDDYASAVLIQPDQKILIAGSLYGGIGGFVSRIDSGGTFEDTFAGDGSAGTTGITYALALAPDGKIVAAGESYYSPKTISVTRLLSGGDLDTDFDGGGLAQTTFPGDARAFGVAVQADGRIVVGGRNYIDGVDSFVLVRYKLDGSIDDTFDGDGKVSTQFGQTQTGIAGLAMQPDGWVVAVGGAQAARYRTDGSLDSGGIQQIVFGPDDTSSEATALRVDGSDRLWAAGDVALEGAGRDAAVARLDYHDGLDASFGVELPGRTTFDLAFDTRVTAMTLQGDKPIVVGQIGNDTQPKYLSLIRFDSVGAPDNTCNFNSYNEADFGYGDGIGRAVATGLTGDIFVAGGVAGPADTDFGLAPFRSDCPIDTSYKLQRVDFGGSDSASGMVMQSTNRPIGSLPMDRVVLAGTSSTDGGSDIVLTKVESEPIVGGLRGVVTTFGTNGKTVLDTGGNEIATALARQSDGKLIVGGWVVNAGTSDFLVARFSANGVLDSTFGVNGIALADFGPLDNAYALAVRDDDTIAIAGCTTSADTRLALAQLTPEGVLDEGFGSGGKTTLKIGSAGSDCAAALTFFGPNRLVAGGSTFGAGRSTFVLAAFETTRDLSATTTTTRPTTTSVTSTTTVTVVTTTTLEPSTTMCGDANGDDAVTATDALIALAAAVAATPCDLCACDVDTSGMINATDALRVLQAAVGLVVTLECPPCG